jgi:hypothetical protein
VNHRPAAWVGFAHDTTSRRTLFEAFVAVRAPFALADRASFRGKPQGTLESILGRTVEPTRIAQGIVDAYAAVGETAWLDPEEPSSTEATDRASAAAPGAVANRADQATFAPEPDPHRDPPWAATSEEAIGTLGAGPDAQGRFRVGGDLLVSRDALARLEARAASANDADLGVVVDETLGAPGVALEGVKSLTSVRDVIARARQPFLSRPRVS